MPQRRGKGEGAVYFDQARDRWAGVVELPPDPVTRRRRRHKVTGRTKTEVREAVAELRRELKQTGTVPDQQVTVEAAVRGWLANPPPKVRSASTRQVNAGHGHRIIAALGSVKLKALTAAQVEAFLHQMAAGGYSTSVISQTRSVLVRAIRRAQRDRLVSINVAALVDVPEGSYRQSRSITLGQVHKLLAADLGAVWHAWMVTAIMTGLRPGALAGLACADVDFATGTIAVRSSLKRTPAGLSRQGLKTASSRRALAMPAAVRDALASLGITQQADRDRLGAHYADSGLVFCDSAGRPMSRQRVHKGFNAACEAAGIGRWQPREARHTFVSLLSHNGVDIDAIADAAGHRSSVVTRTVYRHQISDSVSSAAKAMDAIFGGDDGAP